VSDSQAIEWSLDQHVEEYQNFHGDRPPCILVSEHLFLSLQLQQYGLPDGMSWSKSRGIKLIAVPGVCDNWVRFPSLGTTP
jgi:hypothetical protein